LIRSDPKVEPVGEDFADAIGQHGTRTNFNEDAGASLIECLYLGKELHRAHKVLEQLIGNGLWQFRVWRRRGVRED
jgi:hypothetical protein